ncbi:MAG: DinB family protein [Flavobacteriaceae bacterium]|nr:DinB family protein [Flavobacteriaceae bacterium]
MIKLKDSEYAVFYKTYINTLIDNEFDIIENLEASYTAAKNLFENLPPEKQLFSYAPGKWTIKELVQHLIDTERVFAYRALCFSRNDVAELPGFDENQFIDNCNANDRPFGELLSEFDVIRASSVALFRSFTDEMLLRKGIANGNSMSVRAVGYIISGHLLHHLQVIKQRYL